MLARFKVVGENGVKGVNAWVFYVALPALSLRFVPEIDWSLNVLFLMISPIIMLVAAWLFVRLVDFRKRLDIGTRTALFVTMALSNTGFIGIPMTAAFFGEENMHFAVLNDQITFLLFSTVCVVVVMRAAAVQSRAGSLGGGSVRDGSGSPQHAEGGRGLQANSPTGAVSAAGSTGHAKINPKIVLKKIATFPPFIAFVLALVLPCFVDISVANPVFDKLMATMSPMAVFSIGLQLRLGSIGKEWRQVSTALIYKLFLAPLLILAVAMIIGEKGSASQVSVFEASMSSHITVSLLASQNGLNPRLCSLIVGVGIIAGFVTAPLWAWVIGVFL